MVDNSEFVTRVIVGTLAVIILCTFTVYFITVLLSYTSTDRLVDRDCVREAEFNFEESQLPAEVALEVLTTEVIMCYQLN